MFITFEGGEGCGKTTHSKSLKKYLEGHGCRVVLTMEPGGTPFGGRIRKTLLSNRTVLSPNAELLLFAADRAEHIEKVISPSLKEGKTVICDRFIDSTVAYQIGGRGLPEDMVRYLNFISSGGLLPDVTFILDVSPKVGIKRAASMKSRDRFERENIFFHEKVREAYLRIAGESPGRARLLDAERPLADVQSDIRDIVDKYIVRGEMR